jgi:hypothetical protein
MWNYIDTQASSSNNTLITAQIVDKKVHTEIDFKTGVLVYSVALFLDVTNMSPLRITEQEFSVATCMYFEGERILDITLPSSSMVMKYGLNSRVEVKMQSNTDHLSKLLNFISRYSDGEVLEVEFKKFKIFYDKGRARVVWLDDLLLNLDINVVIPKATEQTTMLGTFLDLLKIN